MNCSRQVLEAVQWMERHHTFDIDQRVHVFELTIRAIGMCCNVCAIYFQSFGWCSSVKDAGGFMALTLLA